jgi:hypothetical protein
MINVVEVVVAAVLSCRLGGYRLPVICRSVSVSGVGQ